MATCKTVWFSETDLSKWFESSKEAELFDKKQELISYIRAHRNFELQVKVIIDIIMERYEITQRWDWIESYKDNQG